MTIAKFMRLQKLRNAFTAWTPRALYYVLWWLEMVDDDKNM